MTPEQTIAEIKALCQRYAHAGCEPGSHALAAKIIKLIESSEEDGK